MSTTKTQLAKTINSALRSALRKSTESTEALHAYTAFDMLPPYELKLVCETVAAEVLDSLHYWHPVDEKLPLPWDSVWIYIAPSNAVMVGYWNNGGWRVANGSIVKNVTHWCEYNAPEPPKE